MTVQDWDREAAAQYGEGWRCVRTMPLNEKVEALTLRGKLYRCRVIIDRWYNQPYPAHFTRKLGWTRRVTGERVAVAWRPLPAADPQPAPSNL